jgi:hypothetical protein
MYILRFTGFCLDIAMLESTKTISWSLMPGIASHLLINGRFVKNTSSRLPRKRGGLTGMVYAYKICEIWGFVPILEINI